MRNLFTCLSILLALLCKGQQSFRFTSDGMKRQSAGVYDENERLIRTLFTSKIYPAGTHTSEWDGKDDYGRVAPQGKYSVRMLSNNVKAEWEGVALNTSSQKSNTVWGGSKKHNGYYGAGIDIYEHNNRWVYYCTGFSENNITLRKFHLDSTDVAVYLKKNSTTNYAEPGGEGNGALGSTYNFASDGQYLYVPSLTWQSGTTNVQNNYVFILKFDLSNDQMAPFTIRGQSISPGRYNYPSAVVLKSGLKRYEAFNYLFTGCAVDGKYLYTAQNKQNGIRTFNKITGESISLTTALPNPRRMVSDGTNLWIIYDNKRVGKFSVTNGIINTKPIDTLLGLSDPFSLSVATVNGVKYVYVTDGGTNQVVKRFRTDNATQDRSFNNVGYFGQLGGYSTSSVVTDNRFYFHRKHDMNAGIHVKNDGTMWVCDDGNNRMMRFNSSLTKTHNVQFQGATYSLVMPYPDSSRIIVEFAEYEVNYRNPILTSWALKRQFEPSWPSPSGNGAVKLTFAKTFSNGKIYTGGKSDVDNIFYIVELTDKGARTVTSFTDEGRSRTNITRILPDGSLIEHQSYDGGKRFVRFAFTGYTNVTWKGETYQNPTWSSTPTVVGHALVNDTTGVRGGFHALTDDNKLLVFDEGRYGKGHHIGTLEYGVSTLQEWKWMAAKAVNNPQGTPYPSDGRFEIGNGVEYPGSVAVAKGDFINWHYKGEFWNGGQANMHHLLYKNGLQLMQYGVAVRNSTAALPKGYPEMGGNAQTLAIARVGDNLHIWQGEEGYHCGVLRWKISGLNTISETVIPFGTQSRSLKASFAADKTSGCTMVGVKFYDLSDGGTEGVNKWSWDFGDGTTSIEQNPSHTYKSVGSYTVTLKVSSSSGTSDTSIKAQYIQVSENPKLAISGKSAGCTSEAVSFSGSSEGGAASSLSWSWDFGNGQTDSAQQPKPQTYAKAGIYAVTANATNDIGCTASTTTMLTVNQSPAVTAGQDMQICPGTNVKLKASGATTYTWNNATSLSCVTCSEPVANPDYSAVYSVTGKTAEGCSSTASVTVRVSQPFKLTVEKTQEICSGNAAKLAASGAEVYTWSPAIDVANASAGITTATPQTSTLYRVTAKDNAGCFMDTASVYVKVSPSPVVHAGADVEVCQGAIQQLKAIGAESYSWQAAASLSCTDCAAPLAVPASSTTYVVTGFGSNGCSSQDSITVKVHQRFALAIENVDEICAGNTTRLSASGADMYTWVPATGVANPTAAVTTAMPQASTLYKVIAKDKHNCFTDTASVFVKVWSMPSVEAGEVQTLVVGNTLKLNPSFSADVTKYQWSPAQHLSCATCPSPTASPKVETTYSVEVSNAGGCTSKDAVTIRVICNNGNLLIPNTFSPNADGRNDWFYPKGTGINFIKSLRVYNRWGELVFSRDNIKANDPAAGWDGTYKGIALSSDVFIYTCEVVCQNNEVLFYKGDVTLLR